ncbi:MAG: hypothetical protein GY851_20990 [bacterium]|nr:hypothetical protein [bacterium]
MERALELLADAGIDVTTEMADGLRRHASLVQEWNRIVSVVSAGDQDAVLERHTVDSLSLASFVSEACGPDGLLLDVGSGGGFPAIPLKVVLPGVSVVLMERSVKKVGFLRKVVGALGLSDVTILTEPFPGGASELCPDAITARAVEKPGKVLQDVLDFLTEGSTFVCQLSGVDDMVSEMFHVEHIDDVWTNEAIRRGSLNLIRRTP